MIPTFKIRCSAIGKIMAATGGITETQLATLAELQKRKVEHKAQVPGVRPLTLNQENTLAELIAKRDAPPQLSAGAKTYCEQWVKEQLYGRHSEFSSKYTEKGVQCEPAAIEMIADRMGYGLISKNEQHYEDDDITGTPDLVLPKIIEEVKNSWDCFTFPLFEDEIPNSDYPLQVQGYMALTHKNKAAVNYCLIDAPEELIDREARFASLRAGFSEVEMELYDEVKAKMTYAGIPIQLRHKRYEFDRDDAVIATIRRQVKLCREYIATIWPVGIETKQELLIAA